MDFDTYQEKAHSTSTKVLLGPPGGPAVLWIYPAIGMAGEKGEIEEIIKKLIRDKHLGPTEEDLDKIMKELGDRLWYISEMATTMGISLNAIAELNIEKLASRYARNLIHGEGDNR